MSSISGSNNKNDTILTEDEDGTTIESDHEADGFSKYFCSVGKKTKNLIEKPMNKVNISPANNPKSIYIFDCTFAEAFNLLQNLDVNKGNWVV